MAEENQDPERDQDPLPDMFAGLNRRLRRMGMDLSVGAEFVVPMRVTVGGYEIETSLRVEVDADGYSIPDDQTGRIKQEVMRDLLSE